MTSVRSTTSPQDLLQLLREADDLVPRMSDDDPIAPALADWLRRVRAAISSLEAVPERKCGTCAKQAGVRCPLSAANILPSDDWFCADYQAKQPRSDHE